MAEPASRRRVEMAAWKRRRHFEVFGHGAYPYVGVTATIDVTPLLAGCRRSGTGFFNAFLYVSTRAMNELENFRYRLREGEVYLYDRVDPAFTVLDPGEELFYFAYAPYTPNFPAFSAAADRAKAAALATRSLENDPEKLWLIYVSCTPWLSFTDLIQPLGVSANDSIPRVCWGRFQERDGGATMPFSVVGHHGLLDGLHIAKLLDAMAELMTDSGLPWG